jgi:hypothetical protein
MREMREMRVRSRTCAGSPVTGVEGLDMSFTCAYALFKIKKRRNINRATQPAKN